MRTLRFLILFPLLLIVQPLISEESSPTVPTEPPPDRFFTELVNMAVTLALVIIALLIISWFVRKMLGKRIQQLNTRNEIKIVEQRSLSQKSAVYILEIYGTGVIVAESTNGITHLGNLPLSAPEITHTEDRESEETS